MVANHFWGKLATSSCYLVDKNCTRKNGDKCFCEDESCKMTGQYGDTSVGKAFSLLKYFTTETWEWISEVRTLFEWLIDYLIKMLEISC